MKNKVLIFFLVAIAGELLAVTLEVEWLEWIFKPSLMITLGAYYYVSTIGKDTALSKLVLAAVLFSLVGDVLLMFQEAAEIFFMLGLGAFLITHIWYLKVFQINRDQDSNGRQLYGTQKTRFALPIVLAGTGLITILYSHLGALRIPVIIYALVLMVMVLQALFRYGRTNVISFWSVFVGALLFMISDSLIAINKFLIPFPFAGLLIMLTYISAQYLIVSGLLKHEA